ncbi:hypothetical protein OE88DRAFT_1653574 [Heliocybe sulcata]|uniref:Uncharacterized protein n=1 Tax=Heliocybe sulcata TaxID=5364 RepID=A0A5C3NDN3_9AGAM|nr:hypothetical protein OE88DRAFT_1653574 [Heliocybe sulcata]
MEFCIRTWRRCAHAPTGAVHMFDLLQSERAPSRFARNVSVRLLSAWKEARIRETMTVVFLGYVHVHASKTRSSLAGNNVNYGQVHRSCDHQL